MIFDYTQMEIFIETERTFIRELLPGDDKGMFEMDSDPDVHKYVGKKPVETIERSREVIEFVRKQYLDNGIGRWAVLEKESGEFMGWTGFKLMRETINAHTNFYDFGYRLKRKFWGQGLATESGRGVLEYGIKLLQINEVYAMTDIDNLASKRVLEKLGFIYKGNFNYDAEPNWRENEEPTAWFEKKIK